MKKSIRYQYTRCLVLVFLLKHKRSCGFVGSIIALIMFYVVVSKTINVPTVYMSYHDRTVEKVVAADGTLMPNVLPKGSYDTVWINN